MNTQKVELPVNTPISVRLTSLDGVVVPSNYGPTKQQVRFQSHDGRALYVPLWIGDQVKALGSRAIRLTKSQDAQRRIAWKVERAEGEQPDGTFAIAKENPIRLPPQVTESGSKDQVIQSSQSIDRSVAEPDTARKRAIWHAGCQLIDAYAALVKYSAEKHGGAVSSQDIRALLLTAYIQMERQAGGRGVER